MITKKALAKLNSKQQQVVRSKGAELMRKLTTQTRIDNSQSLQAMLAAGMKKIPVAPKDLEELRQSGEAVAKELSGNMFPASLLSRVKAAR